MNTKHFLAAAVLASGLFFSSLPADAQRGRDRDGDRRENRGGWDDRDRRDDRYGRDNRNNRGYHGHHRHQPRYRSPRVFAPPVSICLPPARHRHSMRGGRCAAPMCYTPPRRTYHHRWHR